MEDLFERPELRAGITLRNEHQPNRLLLRSLSRLANLIQLIRLECVQVEVAIRLDQLAWATINLELVIDCEFPGEQFGSSFHEPITRVWPTINI